MGGLAMFLFWYWGGWSEEASKYRSTVATTYNAYGFVLGFLVVYRMQLAHSRYWESVTLCNEMRAEWLEAAGSLFSFCSHKPEKGEEVLAFKHLLVRLMSQIHRTAMERLSKDTKVQLPVISTEGMDPTILEFLDESVDRVESLVMLFEHAIMD